MASKSDSNPSLVTQGSTFVREATEELKKVTVPTRQETIQATVVTVIIMTFVAFCLFLMDYLFGNLMASVLK